MSHNVLIENVKINSIPALRQAILELNKEGAKVSLDETAKTFRTWRGQPNKCDMLIHLPTEQFDIGLVKQPDGSYIPVFDHMLDSNRQIACDWNPNDGAANRDRRTIGKLVQRYAVVATELEMAMAGHSCQRVPGENGEMQVVIEYAA